MKRTRVSAVAAAVLGLTLALAAAPAPALAHSDLVSSDPADGAVLATPPQTVSFTFNEDLLPDFVRFIATDPSGQTGDLPVSGVDGPTATLDWPLGAPGGEWTVSYRVVSQDGHPIEGGITFAYDAPAPSPTSTSPTPSPTSAEPTPSPTSAEPVTPTPSPTISPAADTSSGGLGVWAIIGIVLVLLAGVGVVAALLVRRRA